MKSTSVSLTFSAEIYTLKDKVILRLPAKESEKLPSRGQIAVDAGINGHSFRTVLEPDGYWGHWLYVDDALQKAAGVTSGDTVEVTLTTTKEWPEPQIPADVSAALKTAPEKVQTKWLDITPMARWEWIRWVNATGNTDTREIRIEKTISKLNGIHRRPCCFNLAACTDPDLSKSGRLIDAAVSK